MLELAGSVLLILLFINALALAAKVLKPTELE